LLLFLPSLDAFLLVSFFFQAEDGIRYRNVTGVQTCALPILNLLLNLWQSKFHRLHFQLFELHIHLFLSHQKLFLLKLVMYLSFGDSKLRLLVYLRFLMPLPRLLRFHSKSTLDLSTGSATSQAAEVSFPSAGRNT